MENYLDRITLGDCRDHLPLLPEESVHVMLSDIPYGIALDDWDVLHSNTNSALLGQSPAQVGKSGFKRRGKPINGWSSADRNIPREYQEWCSSWMTLAYKTLVPGSHVFIFGARRTIHRAILAMEDAGFLVKDILAWKKPFAHHRAQRLSGVFAHRGLQGEAHAWEGWRLGNLAPVWEPIAWFVKPYKIGTTIADNVLKFGVGAINTESCAVDGKSPGNLLEFGYRDSEERVHEAQKPLDLVEYLITLTTLENHLVLDPFAGSGTTAVACQKLHRHFISFEIDPETQKKATARVGAPLDELSHLRVIRPVQSEIPLNP